MNTKSIKKLEGFAIEELEAITGGQQATWEITCHPAPLLNNIDDDGGLMPC